MNGMMSLRVCVAIVFNPNGLSGSCRSQLQSELPISTGGMGLRPMQSISHAAYFSSLASVMPDFVALNPNPNNNDDISMYESSLMHQQLKECYSELLTQY